MFKFTCLSLYTVAVFISKVSAAEMGSCREDLKPVELECLKKLSISNDEFEAALMARDATLVNPCFWSCYFKKIGLLNDKGNYDEATGLEGLKKYSTNDLRFAKVTETVKKCQTVQDKTVSDGAAGCERGALLATCFMINNPSSTD